MSQRNYIRDETENFEDDEEPDFDENHSSDDDDQSDNYTVKSLVSKRLTKKVPSYTNELSELAVEYPNGYNNESNTNNSSFQQPYVPPNTVPISIPHLLSSENRQFSTPRLPPVLVRTVSSKFTKPKTAEANSPVPSQLYVDSHSFDDEDFNTSFQPELETSSPEEPDIEPMESTDHFSDDLLAQELHNLYNTQQHTIHNTVSVDSQISAGSVDFHSPFQQQVCVEIAV